jgi:hypothetical protein
MTNLMTIHKKGSINRGRFEKFYEEKEGYVRYWGMCDITSRDFQIFIPSDAFYAFLNCVHARSYKNIREILKGIDMDVQRFLLDGVSPAGWAEMSESLEFYGIKESLCYSDLGGIKRVTLKPHNS